MIPGANPIANSINPAAPINGTAQGMPAPKAFGAYTNSPTSNVMGTWGAAQYSGIPGDGANSPQGAPSGGGNYGGSRRRSRRSTVSGSYSGSGYEGYSGTGGGGGGGGDITGARGMGGGMGSIRPDLSPRGSGGFLAMKKGGAIPEEGEDNE